MLGNRKEAYNTLKAVTKTQEHMSAVIEDSGGNILMESTAVLKWWIEYCSGLYNYELDPDTSLLQSNQTPTQEAESLPVLREELHKNGGKTAPTVLTVTCKKIWETKEWPKE